tara:strand:+ start:1709 stop:2191 length:483 start_codon:yes stop_codon:yes gene_type:complete
MKFTEEELNIIYERRPDLRRKTDPSTNNAIIEFLRKYDFVSQLPKNSTSQEWLSLKQQALDHKDFQKFQTDFFNEVNEHNQLIEKRLEDPQMQKELKILIKKYSINERIRTYINPHYFFLNYKDNSKIREETKSFMIHIPFWIWFSFGISIVLIIFNFQE